MRQAYHPDPALHSHPLVELPSLPAGQYCFDARYTVQAIKSAAYIIQCMGALKPHVQCECPMVADEFVASTDGQLNGPGNGRMNGVHNNPQPYPNQSAMAAPQPQQPGQQASDPEHTDCLVRLYIDTRILS